MHPQNRAALPAGGWHTAPHSASQPSRRCGSGSLDRTPPARPCPAPARLLPESPWSPRGHFLCPRPVPCHCGLSVRFLRFPSDRPCLACPPCARLLPFAWLRGGWSRGGPSPLPRAAPWCGDARLGRTPADGCGVVIGVGSSRCGCWEGLHPRPRGRGLSLLGGQRWTHKGWVMGHERRSL